MTNCVAKAGHLRYWHKRHTPMAAVPAVSLCLVYMRLRVQPMPRGHDEVRSTNHRALRSVMLADERQLASLPDAP